MVREAESAIRIRLDVLLLLEGGEVEDPKRDGRVGDRLAGRIDHPSRDEAVLVGCAIDVPHAGQDCDDERHQYEAIEESALPKRAGRVVFAHCDHPFVAPDVRPWMNSFWA